MVVFARVGTNVERDDFILRKHAAQCQPRYHKRVGWQSLLLKVHHRAAVRHLVHLHVGCGSFHGHGVAEVKAGCRKVKEQGAGVEQSFDDTSVHVMNGGSWRCPPRGCFGVAGPWKEARLYAAPRSAAKVAQESHTKKLITSTAYLAQNITSSSPSSPNTFPPPSPSS